MNKIKTGSRQPQFTEHQKNIKEKMSLCFSFKYFDTSQGQDFTEWQKDGLIIPFLEKLKEYSKISVTEALDQKKRFKIYNRFPPKSGFTHPKHVPEDVSWASMHIKGKECVIGHIVANVFYIIFLDKNHQFWITEKKHT